MDNLKTKLRRTAYKAKTTYLHPQNIILAAALALCAVWVISAVATMSKNWEGQRALESARLESARLALEVEMAELNQEYYRSTEYKELVARTTLNKANPDETLVILPKNSSRAVDKYNETDTSPDSTPTSKFSEWLRFLFN